MRMTRSYEMQNRAPPAERPNKGADFTAFGGESDACRCRVFAAAILETDGSSHGGEMPGGFLGLSGSSFDSSSSSNASLSRVKDDFKASLHINSECKHGILFAAILALDRTALFPTLHSWNIISFKLLDESGQNIFHWAVRRQAHACLVELIQLLGGGGGGGGGDVTRWILDRDVNGVTAVHLAAQHSARCLKLLLRELASVPPAELLPLLPLFQDQLGRFPLHYSAAARNLAAIELLLLHSEQWALPMDQKDHLGQTPLMHAVGGAEGLNGGGGCGGSGDDCARVIRLLAGKKHIAATARDRRGMSALHVAVMADNLTALRVMLEELKLSTAVFDNEQRAPLHYASLLGRSGAVRLLLQAGASVSVRDERSVAPVHYAAQSGDFYTLEAIMERSSFSDTCLDSEGRTAMMWAIVWQRRELVKRMLADKRIQQRRAHTDKFQYTALHLAALSGDKAICKLLVEDGYSPMECDSFGATPEHLAAGEGHQVAAMYFAYKRAGPGGQVPLDSLGRSPLAYACLSGQWAAVKMMIQGQPSLDFGQVDLNGCSLLHCAAMGGSLPCVEVLLKAGVNPALMNFERKTAAELAFENGHREIGLCLESATVPLEQ